MVIKLFSLKPNPLFHAQFWEAVLQTVFVLCHLDPFDSAHRSPGRTLEGRESKQEPAPLCYFC